MGFYGKQTNRTVSESAGSWTVNVKQRLKMVFAGLIGFDGLKRRFR